MMQVKVLLLFSRSIKYNCIGQNIMLMKYFKNVQCLNKKLNSYKFLEKKFILHPAENSLRRMGVEIVKQSLNV